MDETRSSMNISPRLQRIAKLAKEHPERAFTNLAHHIDLDLLREAYRRTRKGGAVGVDGVTGAAYAVHLEENLRALLDRAKSGSYRAPAVRRVHIPKDDGRTRPLGIPTFEDKVLQRAVAMVMGAVYEQDFMDCSYGFRPGRSAHQALSKLRNDVMNMSGGWVLEADIKDCFGTLDHGWMRKILSRRIRDGVLIRLVGKWLNAGVLEAGRVTRPTAGSPQGGVISPLLSNVYLHDVLDVWFEQVVKPKLRGRASMVRYADDFVIVFDLEADARSVHEALFARFEKHGLELHPEKTKLIPFERPRRTNDTISFDFLGFTHYWARSRNGYWVVKQKTMAKRFRRSLKRVKQWCQYHRHDPVREQHRYLSAVIRGHCGYYGITGNSLSLWLYREAVLAIWKKWLTRRSNSRRRSGTSWTWWQTLCKRYPLPSARAMHSVLRHT